MTLNGGIPTFERRLRASVVIPRYRGPHVRSIAAGHAHVAEFTQRVAIQVGESKRVLPAISDFRRCLLGAATGLDSRSGSPVDRRSARMFGFSMVRSACDGRQDMAARKRRTWREHLALSVVLSASMFLSTAGVAHGRSDVLGDRRTRMPERSPPAWFGLN